MGTIHVEIASSQSPKREGAVCGDVIAFERTPQATTIVVGDGVGSGIKAHLAATMAVSRLLELLRAGFSLRQSCARLVETNEQAKASKEGDPYVAFTAIRILNDGEATILGYEMPPPLLVGARHASILPRRMIPMGKQMLGESNCFVEPGDGILIFSDGVTTAGLGLSLRNGWGIDGANSFVNRILAEGTPLGDVPKKVIAQSRTLWERVGGDDCTATLASCRLGETVNLFTGPPLNAREDRTLVDRFLELPGKKVVCGATTAKIVASRLGKELTMKHVDPRKSAGIAPPGYSIEGIDLVTEGAVTLNQVYNIVDEDPSRFEHDEVAELCLLLQGADRINIFLGTAANPGHGHISFSQRGILPRTKIVPLLREKLTEQGKLVVVETH
ncbi:MAG: SpoIIE family protein phosphatase [Bacteroidota bacterium]